MSDATQLPEASSGLHTEDLKRRNILAKSLLVGAIAGLLASVFRLILVRVEEFRTEWVSTHHGFWSAIGSIGLAISGGALGLWLVQRFAPSASGSGIPDLKAVVLGKQKFEWRRIIPVKFLSGVFGIGGGLALGREGPTIQMGGATSMIVCEILRIKPGEGERKALVSAGAGAGLAAAFNAPLSGMVFVLEELHGAFTPIVFVAAFLASIVSDVIARVLTGGMPVFTLHDPGQPPLTILPLAALLGVFLGFVGVAFNRILLKSLDLFGKFSVRQPLLVGGAVGLVVGIAGFISPGVVGSGSVIADRALAEQIAIGWIPLIFLVRFLLTIVSYGSGAAGGIFAPLLVLGALSGVAIGGIGHNLWPYGIPDTHIFPVLGMGALLAAVVRAPLTAIVLIVELTGHYSVMLPLLTASLCAYAVAEGLGDKPIYTALLERALRNTPEIARPKQEPESTPAT